MMMAFKLVEGKWQGLIDYEVSIDGEKDIWKPIGITDVPVDVLLDKWEDLVHELSYKEVKYLNIKEHVKQEANSIELETDFKALYGKNNADIRKQHVRLQLKSEYDTMRDLEISMNWIKNYIPLLKEVIRSKQ